MKKRAWLLYPCLAAVATAIYYLTGHDSYLFNLIGLSSPILILTAVWVHKPEARAPWYLFSLGQFLFITGDVLAYNYDKIFGERPAVPRDQRRRLPARVPVPRRGRVGVVAPARSAP